MNDVTKDLREYVIGLIQGNITFNSANVPAYGKAPPDQSFPYILVKSTGMVSDNTKDKFCVTYLLDIEVHTRHQHNIGGQNDRDDISNSVLGLTALTSHASNDFGSDTMFILRHTNGINQEDTDDEFHYFWKILSFEAEVGEN